MKRRDLIKKLENAGYKLDRTGNHAIYEKKAVHQYKSQITVKSMNSQQERF